MSGFGAWGSGLGARAANDGINTFHLSRGPSRRSIHTAPFHYQRVSVRNSSRRVLSLLSPASPLLPPRSSSRRRLRRPRRRRSPGGAAAGRKRRRARGRQAPRERARQRQKTGAPVELVSELRQGRDPAGAGVARRESVLQEVRRRARAFRSSPRRTSQTTPLLVARDIVNSMLAMRPDVRKALIAAQWRTGVIAEVEMTMDIPEYARMKRPGAPARRAGDPGRSRLSRQSVARPRRQSDDRRGRKPARVSRHALLRRAHLRARVRARDHDRRSATSTRRCTPRFAPPTTRRWPPRNTSYDGGRGQHYATTNANEYWAEGVQWWFFSNYGECFAGNVKVDTPGRVRGLRPDAERADQPRLRRPSHPDGRVSRQEDPGGHLPIVSAFGA